MRAFVGCLLICLPCRFAGGQTGVPSVSRRLSLQQAIAQALRQHPSLVRLNEAREAAEAEEQVEAANLLPRLTLEAIEKDGPPSAPGFGFRGLVNSTITRNTGASLVLSQIIYDFGRALYRTRSSRFTAAAAGASERAQRAFVTLGVYQAYYNTLLAQKQAQLATQDVAARELTAKQAQARFDAGLTSRVDVGLARASLAEARVALVNAQNAVQQTFADLNAAMGLPASSQAYMLEDLVPGTWLHLSLATTLEQDIATALTRRAEIQSADAQIRAAEETVRAAEAAELPVLRALASAGYVNVAPGQFGQNHAFAVGLGLSLPLYTGGQVQAEVAAARHQAAAVRAAREEQAQGIRLQVTRARLTLVSLFESRQALAEELLQAQDSVRLASERYRDGLGNLLELQHAQLALLSAETSAAGIRYDSVIAQAAWRYAVGTLIPAATEQQRK